MDWIKISPDTMPQKGKRIILTTKNSDGSKTTDIAVWMGEECGYNILLPGFHPSKLSDEYIELKITHWMPYPEPAED